MTRRRRRSRSLGRVLSVAAAVVLALAAWRSLPHDPPALRARLVQLSNQAADGVRQGVSFLTGGANQHDRPGGRQQARIVAVTAADTMVVVPTGPGSLPAGRRATVRLAGAEVPAPCAVAAAGRIRSVLTATPTVTLERDVAATDPEGRALRYVWAGPRLLDELLIHDGLARATPDGSPNGRYRQLLLRAAAAARVRGADPRRCGSEVPT